MKKIFMVMVVLLSLLIAGIVCAEEFSGTGKGYYLGDFKMLGVPKVLAQINYEVCGITVNDSGKGLFHNASQNIMGALQIAKDGTIEDSGFITVTLTNGDKAFMTYKASGKAGPPMSVKGVSTYIGGTGKAAGITGTSEFTRYTLQPPAEGKTASFSITNSKYTLPDKK